MTPIEQAAQQIADYAFANPTDADREYIVNILRTHAAPTPPAAIRSDMSDAYAGAREDVAIWKKRGLEAEELNRHFMADINGPTFMGEPVAIRSAGLVGEPIAWDTRYKDNTRWLLTRRKPDLAELVREAGDSAKDAVCRPLVYGDIAEAEVRRKALEEAAKIVEGSGMWVSAAGEVRARESALKIRALASTQAKGDAS